MKRFRERPSAARRRFAASWGLLAGRRTPRPLPEVHAGDITPHDGVPPETKHRLEENSLDRLIASHPNSTELKGLWEEYATGRSPEARFVKACDKIDMALQATRYESIQSELELSEFLESALKKLEGSDLEGFL